jgi:cation transport protein ChaC
MNDTPAEEPSIEELTRAILAGNAEGSPIRPRKDGNVQRSDFNPDFIEALRRAAKERGEDPWLSAEELEETRLEGLKHHPKGEDLWVFGYGSLMWNPAMHIADAVKANVRGFHRAFCLSLRMGRGSPEFPGLMLALMPGGACQGVAMRIAAANIESESRILWTREMLSGAYRPVWLRTQIDGREIRSLSFAANPSHNRFLGKLPFDETAKRIATAQGVFGNNRDYLYNTVRSLTAQGVERGPMHALEKHVRTLAEE